MSVAASRISIGDSRKPRGLPQPTDEQKTAFLRSVLGQFEDVRVFEHAITMLAEGMRRLSQSRLKRDTIILLLHDSCGGKIGKRDIAFLLNALESLDKTFLKPV